jgi:hypothetical protein
VSFDAEMPGRRVAALGVGLAQVEVDAHPQAEGGAASRISGGGHGGATTAEPAGSALAPAPGAAGAWRVGRIEGRPAAGRRDAAHAGAAGSAHRDLSLRG